VRWWAIGTLSRCEGWAARVFEELGSILGSGYLQEWRQGKSAEEVQESQCLANAAAGPKRVILGKRFDDFEVNRINRLETVRR